MRYVMEKDRYDALQFTLFEPCEIEQQCLKIRKARVDVNKKTFIEALINEIKFALENEMCLIALAAALTLPDACGKVEYPNLSGETQKRYEDWTNTFVKPIATCNIPDGLLNEYYGYNIFDGKALYKLRCGFFHESFPDVEKCKRKITDDTVAEWGPEYNKETDVINADFRLILEGEMSSGADGYTEYDNGTGKTRDITPEVSVQDICRILYRAAEIYMENNPDKFTDDKIIGIVEKRQNPRLRIIQE